MPKVSIVTPCYNSAEFIDETYDSIKKQTVEDWEWLIVDDNSTDNSYQIIEQLAKLDERIRIFKNTGVKGPGNSRNIGIKNANGNFLTFIDSDDVWHSDFIETSLSCLSETGAGFCFASYERWNEDFTTEYESFIVPDKLTYTELLKTCPISCLTAFINIQEYGKLYMPNLPKRQDYALWLEYLKIIPEAIGVKKPLAKYRMRKASVSSSKRKVIKYQFNIYYKHQKLGIFRSLYYLGTWAYYGFLKYRKIK